MFLKLAAVACIQNFLIIKFIYVQLLSDMRPVCMSGYDVKRYENIKVNGHITFPGIRFSQIL